MHARCQLPRHLPGRLLVLSPLSPLDFLEVQPLPSFLEARPFLGVLEDQQAPYLLVFLEAPCPHRVLEGLAVQSPPFGLESLEVRVGLFVQEDQEAPSRPAS